MRSDMPTIHLCCVEGNDLCRVLSSGGGTVERYFEACCGPGGGAQGCPRVPAHRTAIRRAAGASPASWRRCSSASGCGC